MSTIDQIIKNRIEKLKKLEALGINPYPRSTKRNYSIEKAIADFSKLEKQKKEIILAGRITAIRHQGGLTFINIYDGTGRFQSILTKNHLGPIAYKLFLDNFDIGDFIEITGTLFKTKRGEKTIEAHDYKMLAKSLRPLPEKWHGLQDIEERYRKRYLDLIFNPEVKRKFEIRAKIIKEIRGFLEKSGFIEVETPILQPLYGGAKAKPFKTYLNSQKINLYLRIAPELYLKRLLIGGFDKIYEIGKCFRNEGMDKTHNPDFTSLEFYWAYADYKDLMKLTEKLFLQLVKNVLGSQKLEYQGQTIQFKIPFQRIEFSDLLEKYTKIKYDDLNRNGLAKEAQKLGIKIENSLSKAEIADQIYKKVCRSNLIQPTFIIHYPLGAQPLAKKVDKNSNKLANFQLVIGGLELVNAFSELNNPLEQRERFKRQETLFKKGFEEAQRNDDQFLEALEYGMPPAAGFGMGIDRLALLLTNSKSIREVILFPLMKPDK